MKNRLLTLLIFPIFLVNFLEIPEIAENINNSDVNVKNEVYTNTGSGGKSYSKSETIVNAEKTVMESSEPGSIKVEIQQNNNSSPTVVIEKSQDINGSVQRKKIETPKITKKTTPARFFPILNFWQSFIIQLKKIFKF